MEEIISDSIYRWADTDSLMKRNDASRILMKSSSSTPGLLFWQLRFGLRCNVTVSAIKLHPRGRRSLCSVVLVQEKDEEAEKDNVRFEF